MCECTRTVGGVRTPRAVCATPTIRVHSFMLIHDSDAHRRFLRCVYAIFRPSVCVGTPRGLEHAIGDGLARIADFGYFAQSAGSVSIRVSV